MLTAMKLTGVPEDLAAYHSHEENYYFEQSKGVETVLGNGSENGPENKELSHVKVHGKMAEILGFKEGQSISEKSFTNLLSGKDSAGVQRTRKHKVMGIDLTFSAPKSVSVAGLLPKRDSRIIEAHDQAVLETMREIESYHAFGRLTSTSKVKTDKMIWVASRDGFNRDHDPHLHTHVVVMNMTEHNGKILGLWGRPILAKDFNKLWGSIYRSHLAARLKKIGYGLTYEHGGTWRMDAVSLEVENEFSKRRNEILKAKDKGKRDMDAWRKTRAEKEPGSDKKSIVKDWDRRLKLYQRRSDEENRKQAIEERGRWAKEAGFSIEAKQYQENRWVGMDKENRRWQSALRRATERRAMVNEQQVIHEYLIGLMQSEKWSEITYEEARKRLKAQIKANHFVELEDGRYTSWEMMRTERQLMLAAGAGLLSSSNWLDSKTAKEKVNQYRLEREASGRRNLSDIQATAVEKILAAKTRLVVVQGDAGSGKTTALHAVKEIAEEQGMEVLGVSIQGIAARNMEEEAGIKSVTVASYLKQGREENETPRILVVDEASMLDSRSLSQLIRNSEKNNDKIVLVGDRNQLESLSAGRPFERLVSDAERAGDLIQMNENFRQKDSELRKAVDFARAGMVDESLEMLDSMDRLTEIKEAGIRRELIAKLYSDETLIITGTVAARDNLNKKIRENLIESGKLDEKLERTYRVTRAEEDGLEKERNISIAPGERILFLRNDYRDLDVRNGERAKVLYCDESKIKVEMEDGRRIDLDPKKYRSLDYGYALTTYKSQGLTFKNVVVEADTGVPTLNEMRHQYVQVTRARESVEIFTDDKNELKELAKIRTMASDTLDAPHGIEEIRRAEKKVHEHLDEAIEIAESESEQEEQRKVSRKKGLRLDLKKS